MSYITNIIGGLVLPLIISVIGIFGNLLTIFALYYANRKRRNGFHENWYTSTIYVINLAFIDCLVCLIILIQLFFWSYYMTYQVDYLILNDTDVWTCTLLSHFQTLFGALDSSSIAFISLIRVVAITKSQNWETFCEKKKKRIHFPVISMDIDHSTLCTNIRTKLGKKP